MSWNLLSPTVLSLIVKVLSVMMAAILLRRQSDLSRFEVRWHVMEKTQITHYCSI